MYINVVRCRLDAYIFVQTSTHPHPPTPGKNHDISTTFQTPVIVNKRSGSRGSPQDGTPSTPMRLNRERSNILSQSMPLGGASGTLTNFSVITTEEEIGNLLQV